ncbi:MAG TPA: hypothetical protein OQH54_05190 [Nitrosopumilus sp.]|nr:hypothetical protein [Thermoproteota archaeon]HJJ23093.1 hypothetical protein [Nitrosopumilus sp.]
MTIHKYLVDSKMFEYDKHYRECQQQNKPFIKARINPVNQHCFVQIDLMSCNYELSKQEQKEIKQLVQNEIEFVKSKFHDFNIDKELAWFDCVSSEHVDKFCENLYDLTQKYHN